MGLFDFKKKKEEDFTKMSYNKPVSNPFETVKGEDLSEKNLEQPVTPASSVPPIDITSKVDDIPFKKMISIQDEIEEIETSIYNVKKILDIVVEKLEEVKRRIT